jgi:hypothetical protein
MKTFLSSLKKIILAYLRMMRIKSVLGARYYPVIWRLKFDEWQLNKMKNIADAKSISTNKRCYILYNAHRKMEAVNQNDLNYWKRKNVLNKNIGIVDLLNEAVYISNAHIIENEKRIAKMRTFKIK